MIRTRRFVLGALGAGLVLPASGCGTILYPERHGRKGGRIDPGLVLLNGLWLIFFIVPGVAAFAIDFASGAIYLAPGEDGILSTNDLEQRTIARPVTKEKIEALLEQEMGFPVTLDNGEWTDASDWSQDQLRAALLSAHQSV